MAPSVILTIGHSTHPIEEFLEILAAHQIEQIADVRTIPKSRRNPQFNQNELAQALKRHRIHYIHLPELGGLRHTHKNSINTAWRNESFRGYADYMQTPEFGRALHNLMDLASKRRTAIMCAEAVPWRCHRSLIGDALTVRGIPVEDIMSKTSRKAHTLTSFAQVEGERVTYPGLT